MKAISRIELKLENYDKCSILIDSDCPLGQLFDYACVLKSFVTQQMQAVDNQEAKKDIQPEE